MSRMPDSISDGPQSDDEQIIPEPEFERDTSLVYALRDITLSQQIDRIEDVIESLSQSVYTKRQA